MGRVTTFIDRARAFWAGLREPSLSGRIQHDIRGAELAQAVTVASRERGRAWSRAETEHFAHNMFAPRGRYIGPAERALLTGHHRALAEGAGIREGVQEIGRNFAVTAPILGIGGTALHVAERVLSEAPATQEVVDPLPVRPGRQLGPDEPNP